MIALDTISQENSLEKLARWWNLLNGWDWPSDLPGKPQDWNTMVIFWGLGDYRRGVIPCRRDWAEPICKLIKEKIGLKECLRYLHINELGKSHIDFEIWWKFREPL